MKEIKELVKNYWLGCVLALVAMIVIDHFLGTICLSTILLGIPCPSCGITRATILMLTGHFRESLQMHPLLPIVIFGVLGSLFIKIKLKKYLFLIKYYVIIAVAVFVIFYIYRMKLYYPDVEPMVYTPDNVLHHFRQLIQKCR